MRQFAGVPDAASAYLVDVATVDGTCRAEVDGEPVAYENLIEIARPHVQTGRPAIVRFDRDTTSFRCMGGALYELQRAGFRDVRLNPPLSEPDR